MDNANSNKSAKENTTVKSAKNSKPARQVIPAPRDIQRGARKIIQKMGVILKVTVPTNMEQNKDTTKTNETDAKIDLLEMIVTEMASKILNHKNVISNTEETEVKDKVKCRKLLFKKCFFISSSLRLKSMN